MKKDRILLIVLVTLCLLVASFVFLPASATVPTDFIDLSDEGFSPSVAIVRVGTNVTWRNNTSQNYVIQNGYPNHTYLPVIHQGTTDQTTNRQAKQAAASFSGPLPANGDFSHRFDEVGEYPYFGRADDGTVVTGVVIVEGIAPTPTATPTAVFTLTSSAFVEGGPIPTVYTFNAPPQCSGQNISVPLTWEGAPTEAVSFVLIMDDPDAANFVHWVQFNIPATQNSLPEVVNGPEIGVKGRNDFGLNGYGGPCPPSGTHRYVFTLYALDSMLSLATGASRAEVVAEMAPRILQQTELVGVRSR